MVTDSDALRGAARVTRAGTVLLETAGGPADASGSTDCSTEHVFQVASVSKQFTAATALLLAEDGLLALTDPVAKWLPEWPARWSDVTLHHLLTHTAGVGHWEDVLPGGVEDLPPLPQVLSAVAGAPLLDGPPPCPFRYSSPGYLLAADVLQRAAGMSYERLVAERVFRPLGMTSTSSVRRPAGGVTGGLRDGARTRVFPDLSVMAGTGEVWSTVGDLTRYTEALRSGRLLAPASLDAAHTPQAAVSAVEGADMRAESYGYGTFLGTVAGHRARFHPGDNWGYRSFHGWLPDLDVTVAVLSNDEATDAGAVAAALVRTALGG